MYPETILLSMQKPLLRTIRGEDNRWFRETQRKTFPRRPQIIDLPLALPLLCGSRGEPAASIERVPPNLPHANDDLERLAERLASHEPSTERYTSALCSRRSLRAVIADGVLRRGAAFSQHALGVLYGSDKQRVELLEGRGGLPLPRRCRTGRRLRAFVRGMRSQVYMSRRENARAARRMSRPAASARPPKLAHSMPSSIAEP